MKIRRKFILFLNKLKVTKDGEETSGDIFLLFNRVYF